MQIEVNVDDELLTVARSYVSKKMPLTALLLLAVQTYVRVQKSKRLSALGEPLRNQQDLASDAAGRPTIDQKNTLSYWSTIDSRGRITIPAAIRAHLVVKRGDQLIWDVDGDGSLKVVPKPRRKRVRKL